MEKMGGGVEKEIRPSIARSFAAMRHYEVLDGFGMCLAMFFQKIGTRRLSWNLFVRRFLQFGYSKRYTKDESGIPQVFVESFLPNRSIFDFWNKINRQNQ